MREKNKHKILFATLRFHSVTFNMLLRTSLAIVVTLQLLFAAGGILQVEGKVGFGPGEQEWGYVTVRQNAHMFWWLYYTTSENVTDVHEKPLIIWLQGGPGDSSTGFGNFEELGPLDLDLNPRNTSWVKDYNVLFIDNPVGSGFSYTEGRYGEFLAKNNAQIASDLLECVRGFLNEFPKFTNVPTYIVAESYGGKMAAEFALVWEKAQKIGNIRSNFQGVAFGNSWISPIDSVLAWASFLFQTGMVDTKGFKYIQESAKWTKTAVDNKDWFNATMFMGDTGMVVSEETGHVNFYNILCEVKPSRFEKRPRVNTIAENRDDILRNLMNGEVKKALGVNVTWGKENNQVSFMLAEDNMKPVTNIVEKLLNETDIEVFVFNGQLDLIVSTSGTLAWVEKLKWTNSSEWHEAARIPLVVDNVIEGYVKEFRNFKMYWVNRAGHMVPRDNPAAISAMLKHFTAKANFKGAQNKT